MPLSGDRPLRVGVVGADRDGRGFGARAHIPAVLAAPDLTLAAVCTTREETARLAAERYGAERHYAGIDALLADDSIDLITIAVTVRAHLPLVWAALHAGRPVYCEWPLGLNAEEGATMARLAHERGVITGVGTQGRFAPGLVRVRELIDEGYVGRPLFFRMHHLLPRFPVRSDHWWSALEAEHSGALGVGCAHATDALEGVLGPIASLSGYADTLHPHDRYADSGEPFRWSAMDTVSYQAVMASGVTGTANVSNATTEQIGFRLEVYGEEGQLIVDAPYYVSYSPMTVHGMRAGDDAPTELEVPARLLRAGGLESGSPGHTLAHALGALRDALVGGPRFAPDMVDAYRLHLLIATIKRSWHERRWLDVPSRDALLG